MTKCPKCGCYNILGPRYERDMFGSDRLRYRCSYCGYGEARPCLDRSEREWPPLIYGQEKTNDT